MNGQAQSASTVRPLYCRGLQHWIGRAGQNEVALGDGGLELAEQAACPKLFELIVPIEDHGRDGKAAGRPTRLRMQTDDEEGLTAEAQGKVRAGGVGADPHIVALTVPVVLVGKRLDARPQVAFELGFGQGSRPLEENHQALERLRRGAVIGGERTERRIDAQIVPSRGHVPGHHETHLPASQGGFGSHAREG